MSLEVFAVTFVEYCVDEKFAGVSFQVRKWLVNSNLILWQPGVHSGEDTKMSLQSFDAVQAQERERGAFYSWPEERGHVGPLTGD